MSLAISAATPSVFVQKASAPTPAPAAPSAPNAVDRPNDGDKDDGAAPASAAKISSPSTQAGLMALKPGG